MEKGSSQGAASGREDAPTSAPHSAGLSDLLARVEAATGADRELSVAIWYAFHPDREELWGLSGLNAQRGPRQNTERDLRRCVQRDPEEYGWCPDSDNLTASLDAALALVERVLPGWTGGLTKRGDGLWYGEIVGPMISRKLHEIYSRTGKTPALALLAALLKALIAQAERP